MKPDAPQEGGPESQREESWFAALGLGREPPNPDLANSSNASAGKPAQAQRKRSRRRFIQAPSTGTPGHRPEDSPGQTRIYRAFALARALLGALMVLAQVAVHAYGLSSASWSVMALCVCYAAAAALALRQPRSLLSPASAAATLRKRWFLATVGLDLLCFGALVGLVGPGLNVAALYALPVLMAASLTARQVALSVAAIASLTMLSAASLQSGGGDAALSLMQAGLAGGGLFTIAWLTSELAARLAREERTARNTLALARQQALLNRLVIEEMQDGVLVVDRQGLVRAANPSALSLIGAPASPQGNRVRLSDRSEWRPLAQAIDRAYASGSWPDGGRDIRLLLHPNEARMLRLRLRFTRKREPDFDEAMCVLFIEDVRTLRARAQQEKLAAMGRLSAGIAHEIRNPLAAITQANALLSEDLKDPGLHKLAAIVADNALRLRRIVDDVMTVAPTRHVHSQSIIDLSSHVRTICSDWLRTNNLANATDAPLQLRVPNSHYPVRFEVDHLRRILVNLLDNAWRHGSHGPDAITLSIDTAPAPEGPRVWLSVGSDGAPITPDVERHLFEPFFSTDSRGTGLGLYICRELCERYGASIEYRAGLRGTRAVNCFVLSLPMQATAQPAVFADSP